MIEHLKYLWRRCRYCKRHRAICMWLPCEQRKIRLLHVFGDGRKWTGREDRMIIDVSGRYWELVSRTGTSISIHDLPMRPFDESVGEIGAYLIIPTMALLGLGDTTPGNIVFKRVG